MKWTTAKPTVTGFYRWRCHMPEFPQPEQEVQILAHPGVSVGGWTVRTAHRDRLLYETPGEWLGPL